MIKFVEFPTEFHDVYSVTINGVTFINVLYDEAETITLFIPSIKIQLVPLIAPA
jgi:tryptophan synthase alpha subunit